MSPAVLPSRAGLEFAGTLPPDLGATIKPPIQYCELDNLTLQFLGLAGPFRIQ